MTRSVPELLGRPGAPPVCEDGLLRRVARSVHGAVDPAALRAEGVDPASIVDFSSNQSPLGAAPGVAAAVASAVVDAYPDPRATDLTAALAGRHGVDPAQVVCGNGSTELIRLLAQLALRPGGVALALAPVFGECEVATALAGARLERVPLAHAGFGRGFACDEPVLRAALERLRPSLCWLCSPNNPTGSALTPALVADLVAVHPHTLFVLDEAYCDLLAEPQWERASLVAGNLVVLHSMTKYWGLAGLRLGYAVASRETAAALRAAAPPWSVNACAQAAGIAALDDLAHPAGRSSCSPASATGSSPACAPSAGRRSPPRPASSSCTLVTRRCCAARSSREAAWSATARRSACPRTCA
jgi:histidinol-phosphate/aromatic aminotransferase/cobyric acid decarboxylase-like protein